MDKIITKILNFLSYSEDLKKDRPILYDMLFTINQQERTQVKKARFSTNYNLYLLVFR